MGERSLKGMLLEFRCRLSLEELVEDSDGSSPRRLEISVRDARAIEKETLVLVCVVHGLLPFPSCVYA